MWHSSYSENSSAITSDTGSLRKNGRFLKRNSWAARGELALKIVIVLALNSLVYYTDDRTFLRLQCSIIVSLAKWGQRSRKHVTDGAASGILGEKRFIPIANSLEPWLSESAFGSRTKRALDM